MLDKLASILYYVAMKGNRPRLSDELRRAIETSGLSRYRIAKELGIAESTLSRFMSGERGLTMTCLDRLAALLDLHIATGSRRKVSKSAGSVAAKTSNRHK